MGTMLLDSPGKQGRKSLRWPLIALLWTGIALVVATQNRFYESAVGRAEVCPHTSSAIINLDFVGELKPIWSGDYRVTLRNGTELTWSRAFRHKLDPGKHKP